MEHGIEVGEPECGSLASRRERPLRPDDLWFVSQRPPPNNRDVFG